MSCTRVTDDPYFCGVLSYCWRHESSLRDLCKMATQACWLRLYLFSIISVLWCAGTVCFPSLRLIISIVNSQWTRGLYQEMIECDRLKNQTWYQGDYYLWGILKQTTSQLRLANVHCLKIVNQRLLLWYSAYILLENIAMNLVTNQTAENEWQHSDIL